METADRQEHYREGHRVSRERAEAVVILGRDVVEAALAGQEEALDFFRRRPGEVREAVEGLLARLNDIPDAAAFARDFSPELSRAIAAAWAGGAGEQIITELLEEVWMGSWGGKRQGAGRRPKAEGDKKVTASFTLPPEYVKALGDYAKKRRISRSEAILELLEKAGVLDAKPVDAHPEGEHDA